MSAITASPALAGLRVLDLSRVRAGPTCVRVLADFGADVVRIEPPPGVDPNEAMFAGNRMGGDFQNLNRNKRSLSLNLKKPEGLEVLKRLVRDADVVVENWRPDVKARLGLDYESLRAINPRVILASISGFGQDGPYAGRPGFDQVVQGMGGLMSVTGTEASGPMRAGIAVADSSTGLYAAIGILVALAEREKSGQGQWVHASLLHAQVAMMDFQVARFLNEGDVPRPAGNDHPTSAPMGLFHASDGSFNVGASGEGTWQRLCRVIGRPEWIDDPEYARESLRVRHRARLNAELDAVFAGDTVASWVERLNDAGVPCGPVYTVPQLVEDPQIRHLGVVERTTTRDGVPVSVISQPVRLSRTPAAVVTAAPGWGEQTDEVLREAGYDDAAIARLRADAVV
ncbi:MAG TPA: CoA transferase [Burkholderiaceae bacterium]|nr:CoA transferase [Burkholderiaceae bacterium]